MASAEQVKRFIEQIAPCAQNAYKVVGKVLPSICIGMACVESAYGAAGSCKYHSYLGQKVGTGKTATKYWGGKFFKSKTKEEYQVGVHTTIVDGFRSYDSMQQCVLNYYELLNTKLYARVTATKDYRLQMQQIKQCGYMTSSTEVNSVINIIEKYGLTKYDGVNVAPVNTVDCYPIPMGYSGESIISALKKIGVCSTFVFRVKIAAKNGIENYTGTKEQNIQMLNLLKVGKLKRA